MSEVKRSEIDEVDDEFVEVFEELECVLDVFHCQNLNASFFS